MTSVGAIPNKIERGRSVAFSETKNEHSADVITRTVEVSPQNVVAGSSDVITRDDVTNKVTFHWRRRLKREIRWEMMSLSEKNPRKFATSAWFKSHVPYVVFRTICFVHAVAILSWRSYEENTDVQSGEMPWIMRFPTWSFILYTSYHTLALMLCVFEFFHDCLCNDDLVWYHKLCWVLQTVSFNGVLSCSIGSIIYIMSEAAGDQQFMNIAIFFKSDDVNFYVISGIVTTIDVILSNTTIRVLHVVYPTIYYVVFFAFHIYRWGSRYTPYYRVLDYGSSPDAAVPFIILVLLLYCPFVHVILYAIDSLRWKLLITCVKRHRLRLHDIINEARATSSGSRFASSRGYSRIQTSRETKASA